MIKDNIDNPRCKWNFKCISTKYMDQPYYRSKYYNKFLVKKIVNVIFNDLIKIACHPSRHPANYMDDMRNHPYVNLSSIEIMDLFIDTKN